MSNDKLSFVFFGSGPVAAASLSQLHTHFICEAVVTKATTLHEMKAVSHDAPVYTVSDKQTLDELITTKKFTSTIGILIDFGIIVSEQTINRFEKGIINSHFSLLPELRGADPITFAILEGKKSTGVSLMLLVKAMDEGPLIAQEQLLITPDETTLSLTEKLITLSTRMLQKHLPDYLTGKLKPVPQDTTVHPTYTRKLQKIDGKIDWTKSAETIEREIRAYTGWPKSYTELAGIEIIITKAYAVPSQSPTPPVPGSIVLIPETHSLGVETANGTLYIQNLKPVGKKEMDIQAFLAGYRDRFSS